MAGIPGGLNQSYKKRYGASGKEISQSRGGMANIPQGPVHGGGTGPQYPSGGLGGMRPQRPESMGPIPTSPPSGPRPAMGGDSMRESSMAFDKWAQDNGKDRSYTGMDISQMADADRKLYAEWEAGGGMNANAGGAPPTDPNKPWVQGGGTTRLPGPGLGTSGGQGVRLQTNPYMANRHEGSTDGVLAMRQIQNAQRNTPGAYAGQMSSQAQANGRYSVGPYGALVSPNAPQINPTTGAPMAPVAGGGLGSAADYNAKYQEAKAANESRYAEGKGELSSLRDRSMGYLEGAGQQERADIRQSGEAAKATSGQRLQSLGLAGTTIGQTTNSGIDRETNDSLGRSNERTNQQKLGTDSATTNNLTGFIERRTDAYPDMNVYAQLQMAQSANSGSGGQATGGSYGGQNPQTGQQGGGQRTFINNSQGYGPITGANFTQPQQPTGVNLEYLTGAALNDPAYMKAFGNTPMTSAPKRIIDKQKYWM